MFAQPVLPPAKRRIGHVGVHADIDLDAAHAIPWNAVVLAVLWAADTDHETRDPGRGTLADASPYGYRAGLERNHLGRPAVAQLNDDSIDAAHLRAVPIHQLFVEYIPHEIHHVPPAICRGSVTIANTKLSATIAVTTALENAPLR